MPQCHRCGRVQASCELRRTPLGHVCKDNGKGSRCALLAVERRKESHAAQEMAI